MVAVLRNCSRMVFCFTLVKASAGLYLVRIKPMFSNSPFLKDSLTVHKSIISLFSVVVVALLMMLKSERLSVMITIGIDCWIICSRSCRSLYAISKASVRAIVSLPSTERETRLDL